MLDERAWDTLDPTLTNSLSLKSAKRLAQRYSQVAARVIQDENSGEAIGCITFSVGTRGLTLELTEQQALDQLNTLADGLAKLLILN